MKSMADAHERVFIYSLVRAWWGLFKIPHLATQLSTSLFTQEINNPTAERSQNTSYDREDRHDKIM